LRIATDSGTLDWTSPNLPQVLGKRLPEGRNPQLRCIASYVFDGLSGRLDHALATPSLAAQVTGATEWHINADEPSFIDYNTEFKAFGGLTLQMSDYVEIQSVTRGEYWPTVPEVITISYYRAKSGHSENQRAVADAGAVKPLIAMLLKEGSEGAELKAKEAAAGALWSMCSCNFGIQNAVADEGGIAPLVSMLNSSDAEMQAIAAEFNLSETTFVLPPADAANTARVRIFTPARELPFAGHPNVGTGWALAGRAIEGVLRFEELAGLVRVSLERDAAGNAAKRAMVARLETVEALWRALNDAHLERCKRLLAGEYEAVLSPAPAAGPFCDRKVPEGGGRAPASDGVLPQVRDLGRPAPVRFQLWGAGGRLNSS
jgi:hypothetical protein